MNDPDKRYKLHMLAVTQDKQMVGMIRNARGELDLPTVIIPGTSLDSKTTHVVFEPKGSGNGLAIQLQVVEKLPELPNKVHLTFAEFMALCASGAWICDIVAMQNIRALAEGKQDLWKSASFIDINILKKLHPSVHEQYVDHIMGTLEHNVDLEKERNEGIQHRFTWILFQSRLTSPSIMAEPTKAEPTSSPETPKQFPRKRSNYSVMKSTATPVKLEFQKVKEETADSRQAKKQAKEKTAYSRQPEEQAEDVAEPADGSKLKPIVLD